MRKIVNSTYVSIDGVIQHLEDWHFEYFAEDGNEFGWEQLAASDALLMGRLTYEGFADAWPSRTGDYADKFNGMRKYVVSTTLTEPEWENTTVIGEDPAAAIQQLKEEPGNDIIQYGFGRLSSTMMEHDLLDELRLWVHPVFVGGAEPGDLLYRDCAMTRFDLVDTRVLKTGVAILSYRRV
jgi:dihydrofolate reductase